MQFLDITFDGLNFPELIDATESQMKTAHRRALSRTLTWLSTRLNREVGSKYDMPQRIFKIRSKKNIDGVSGKLWIGLNPIVANYIGAARQTRKGVSVRSHRFANAFIAKMSNGHVGVFERGERKINSEGKVHYALKRVTVALDDGNDAAELLKKYESLASQYYEKTFSEQFKYLIGKGR